MKTATTTTTPGTLTLVARWNKGDYYTLEAHNGETVITGSGKAGLQRAIEYAAKNPEAYSHIRNEFDNTFRVLGLTDPSAKTHPFTATKRASCFAGRHGAETKNKEKHKMSYTINYGVWRDGSGWQPQYRRRRRRHVVRSAQACAIYY